MPAGQDPETPPSKARNSPSLMLFNSYPTAPDNEVMTVPPPLTGERTMPGIPHENYWYRRHEAAYQHISGLVCGRTVLDVGCGEGYGTAALSNHATTIIGLDYDRATVHHAAHTYPRSNFVVANLAALPIADASIDFVITLQVIEHVWDHAQFLQECARVLRAGGRIVITTPNRLTFSPGQEQPVNPFHSTEFTAAELATLVATAGIADVELFGVHAGARLTSLDQRHGGLVAAQLAMPAKDWSAELLADVASIATTDFAIVPRTDRRIDASLDILLVARRP